MVKGEYAVMEMNKARNWVRGRELGRRCRRYGSSFSFMNRTDAREGKGKSL
jgi:hypothetical protein